MDETEAGRRAWLERWHDEVQNATMLSESMFLLAPDHLTRDKPTKTFFVSVITEEVGKLARVCNKLSLFPDVPLQGRQTEAKEQFIRDGQKYLRTIASLVRRMAELWPDLPDEHTGGPNK